MCSKYQKRNDTIRTTFVTSVLLLSMRVLMTNLTHNVHIQNIEGNLLNEQNSPIPTDRPHRVVLGTSLERLEHVPKRIWEGFTTKILPKTQYLGFGADMASAI